MLRLTIVFVVSVCFLPAAHATLAPGKEPANKVSKHLSRVVAEATSVTEKNDELVITDQTEIKVDGCASKYEDVPSNAEIILLEVASDKKAILKLHFQTKK